jgi:hypothetical protein
MSSARGPAVVVALCALAAAGCGLGPGASTGEVELTVTRDYGKVTLSLGEQDSKESDTVLRILDRQTDVETRYGGGFVQAIDGLSGGVDEGRSSDWFFYVNGIESPVGAAEYRPEGGDRIWWDYRDWTAAMRVPAVVGSYPEPFLHGFEGEQWPVGIVCEARDACGTVRELLREAGVEATVEPPGSDAERDQARLLVGRWELLRDDPVARLLESGPEISGVFATFGGNSRLTLLDKRAQPVKTLRGAGLVAALRPAGGPPTWVVTGTNDEGVARAASSLVLLEHHYAMALGPRGTALPLPLLLKGDG